MVNKSYAIGYRFEQRVKKYMEKQGWNVLRQGKSRFPDLICWRTLHSDYIQDYNVIMVECKCNKYLSKEEKQKAGELLEQQKCSGFYVAYRNKRELFFYRLKKFEVE